ncbi:MAG: glycoside hydrolase family 92 protein, partial [Cyclobacteriaceae bacterium]
MSKQLYVFFTLAVLIISCQDASKGESSTNGQLVDYVDPFIGTGGHGHTYPGATTPFGMVQLSPDNGTSGWDWCGGYHYSDSIIVGFSHTHLSGTGIGDMADILLMPATAKVDLSKMADSPRDLN